MSPYCQQRKDVALESLFRLTDSGRWEELAVEDKTPRRPMSRFAGSISGHGCGGWITPSGRRPSCWQAVRPPWMQQRN